MAFERDYLNRIGEILDEYTAFDEEYSYSYSDNTEVDEDYDYDEYTCIPCKIRDICLVPTNNMESKDVYYLIDTLREILVSHGILPDKSRVIEKGVIDVSDCTDRELIMTLDNIIDKITSLLYDKHLLG